MGKRSGQGFGYIQLLKCFFFFQLHCETKGAFVISEEAIASFSPPEVDKNSFSYVKIAHLGWNIAIEPPLCIWDIDICHFSS